MSRRMSFSLWPRLWIVWSLLFVGSLKAEPPKSEPTPQRLDPPVLIEGNDSELRAQELPLKLPQPAAQVLFNVTVWDVDHASLRALTKSDLGVHDFYKDNGLIQQPDRIASAIGDALNDLLSPPARKAAAPVPLPLRAFTVRDKSVSMKLLGQDISSVCKTIAEPSLVATSGREASLLSGGEVPMFVPRTGDPEVVGWHEFGVKLKLLPQLLNNNRIALGIDFENSELCDPKDGAGDSSIRLVFSQGFRLSAKMKLGEWLLVAQQIGKRDVTRLVQIQPTLVTEQPVAEKPNRQVEVVPQLKVAPAVTAVADLPKQALTTESAKWNGDGTISLEDRWPVAEIEVGQQVSFAPVFFEKNSLRALVDWLVCFVLEDAIALDRAERAIRVVRVEHPTPGSRSRRVTLALPLKEGFVKETPDWFVSVCDAATVCVIPTKEVRPFDFHFLDDLYDALPTERRPRPVEIVVGTSFVKNLILEPAAYLLDSAVYRNKLIQELAPLVVDGGDGTSRTCRVTANKPGISRLIELTTSKSEDSVHRTEYFVKADTRELELHLTRLFPTATVKITSLGATTLILMGTAASEEDSRGIVELAEQFAPKVLNRLKVGVASASIEITQDSVQQANGVQPGPAKVIKPHRRDVSKPSVKDLERILNQEYPNGDLEFQVVGNKTIVSGGKYSPEDAAQIIKTVEQFSENVVNKLVIDARSSQNATRIAEPQRVKPRKAARDNAPKTEQLQLLRDEIRDLRQEVRELIQRLDREQAVPAAQQLPMPQSGHTVLAPAPQVPLAKNDETVADKAWRMLGLRVASMTESERKSLHPKYQGGMKVTEVRRDKLSPGNGIRKDDILVGLHVWETTSFENLRFVLDHPQLAKLDSLKFYFVRGTETLYGHLKLLEPPKPVPEATRTEPLPRSRSIALADLPMKLVTEFDKIKLHVEVDRALVETALEARGITVTDDEIHRHFHLTMERGETSFPVDLVPKIIAEHPQSRLIVDAFRQQLALLKLSGKSIEPTAAELQDAYQRAQAGYIFSRQISFADKDQAHEVARELHANPQRFEELAGKHGQLNSFASSTLIPSIPPNPQDEPLAKLKDGEVSDVIQVGDRFTIYQRRQVVKPQGTFDQLKRPLRATLILNKTNEIGQREIEKLRKEYRLIVVPAGATSATAEPAAAVPAQIPIANADWLARATSALSKPTPKATKLEPMPAQPATVGITENDLRIAEQLETKVELDAKELPLSKVVEQLARKADINIVLDKAGLDEAGVTTTTPVTRTLSGVKLRSALKIVLEPLKLSYVIDGEVLKITSPQRAAGPLLVVAYPVADLLPANAKVVLELERLIELIRGSVAPTSWDKVGGSGSIVRNAPGKSLFVRQTHAVHGEIHDFIELLRKTARPTNSRDAAAGLLNLSEEELRITRQLGKSIDLEIEQGTLGDAMKQLASMGDFNIVIDTAGLADESLTLKSPVSIRVKGVRLATALRLLLEPLNLDYVIKHSVLQVTSLSRAAGRATITTYSVADLLEPGQPPPEELDRLSELIQSMIDPNSWEAVGGGAAIKRNPTTQSLVIRQSQANQARIRELLETMRKLGDRKEAPAANKPPTRGTPPLSAVEPDRRVGKEKEKEMTARLKTKVSVHFANTPLVDLLEHLSREAKINIVLDLDGLKDEALSPQTPVSLAVDQITLRSVLALLLEPLNLDFTQDADGLKVSSTQRIQGALIPVTYSVADLVCPIEGLEIQLTKNGTTTPPKKKKLIPENAATLSFEELVKLIRSTVAPNSWSEVGGTGQIKAQPDTLSLVIHQSQTVHNEIRDLLEQLRRLHDLQVSFELRVLKFDAGFPGVSSSLPEGWNEASSKKPLLLSAEQSAVLLKAANDTNHRNSLWQAPKITLLNGQRVLLSTDSDSPVSPLRVTATHAISADRQSVRMSLAADAGSSNYSITTHIPNGQSLLFNVTDASSDGTQVGIPILSKVPNADRFFKNVTKPALKSGESLFLLATPRVIVVEDSDKAESLDSASEQK